MAVDKFGNPTSDQYSNIPAEYMEGFRASEFNRPVVGGMAVTNVTLPSGQRVQFGDTGSAAQFRNYLASINVVPQPETGVAQIADQQGNIGIEQVQQPVYNFTYEQALMRSAQRDVKSPEENAAIAAALQAGKPQGTADPSQFIQGQVGAAVRQPTLPTGTSIGQQLQLQQESPGTIQPTVGVTGDMSAAVPTAPTAPTITPTTVAPGTQVSPTQFQETFRTYTPTTVGTAAQAEAEQTAVQQNELVQAQQAELSANATVRGQLANITADVENALAQGNPLPPFARGAQRVAEAAMAKRGLGASSIAAEAIAEGVLRAGTQIAAADAEAYRQIILSNLNNRQQAAIRNADIYFNTDMTNLSNRQSTSLQNLQFRQQTLLSDASATNAAEQFNATSQKQTDEFFDSLQSQIQSQNAQRTDAMNQFSVSESNRIEGLNAGNQVQIDQANAQREAALNQFNAQLGDARQRFNVENQRVIDQSNVAWRRQINTANTAAVNAANQTDAANLMNLSNFAMSALWQQWRDEASWANTSSENIENRNHNIVLSALEREAAMDLIDEQSKIDLNKLIGGVIAGIIKDVREG
jgi:hypothetical protein